MTTPVDIIKISLKGSPSEINVWDGMTLADVRLAVTGVKSTMVCMGREVGATASTQLTDQTIVCKNGQAVYSRLTFAQGGESNTPNEEETMTVKSLPVMEEKKDRKEETTTVKNFNKFVNRGAVAFNRYHALVADPQADKGDLAVAVAGDSMSQSDAIVALQNVASTLPQFGEALVSEAVDNDTSALALEIAPIAVRVFTGTEIKGDHDALTAYLNV